MMSDKWHDNFLKMAEHIAGWSKDPSSKIGAVAVGDRRQILATGYNGFPRGIKDYQDRLETRETKYKFMVHGEMNCIYNATLNGVSLNGADLYVHGLPVCSECAKGIIQVGIKRVFMRYPNEVSQKWLNMGLETKEMFAEAGVEYYSL